MTINRKINFNAGPAALPNEVLVQAAATVIEYNNTGISILELPHRGKEFLSIIEESKQLVKELCGLDDRHEVLWMQGGGRLQFCMIPMNFLSASATAGYIDSGHWSAAAIKYAQYYGEVAILASSKNTNYNCLPTLPNEMPKNLAYLHLTTNNTIYGTQWHSLPQSLNSNVPLIADMSSDIFSCQRDYTQYAMFYAAAQKNLGIAGNGLVVINRDMLNKPVRNLPSMLDYREHIKENSVLNTANVFGVYVSLLILRWIKAKGIAAIELENKQKANLLYHAIDNSNALVAYIEEPQHRSQMNVCFFAKSIEAEQLLYKLCQENNMTGIKGHRAVGGFRVSLYNAIPIDAVEKLTAIIASL